MRLHLVMGAPGAGKTSLLRTLVASAPPDALHRLVLVSRDAARLSADAPLDVAVVPLPALEPARVPDAFVDLAAALADGGVHGHALLEVPADADPPSVLTALELGAAARDDLDLDVAFGVWDRRAEERVNRRACRLADAILLTHADAPGVDPRDEVARVRAASPRALVLGRGDDLGALGALWSPPSSPRWSIIEDASVTRVEPTDGAPRSIALEAPSGVVFCAEAVGAFFEAMPQGVLSAHGTILTSGGALSIHARPRGARVSATCASETRVLFHGPRLDPQELRAGLRACLP